MGKFKSGFTLIELVIAIAILAILAAIATPHFFYALQKSQESATKGNLGALRAALSLYYTDNDGSYPASPNTLVPKYINKVPDAFIPANN